MIMFDLRCLGARVVQPKSTGEGVEMFKTFVLGILCASCLVLCGLGPGPAAAEQQTGSLPEVSKGEIQFHVDYAAFKNFEDEDLSYIEVYLSILVTRLGFVQAESLYMATVEVNLVLRDVRGSRVHTDTYTRRYTASGSEEAQVMYFQPEVFSMEAKPGDYALEVKVRDTNSTREGSADLKVHVPPFKKDKLTLSQIEFAVQIEPDTSDHKFVKNGQRTTPNPMRIYGINWPMLFFYAEIYNLSMTGTGPSTYTMQYAILDEAGNIVKEYPAKNIQKPGTSSILSGGANVGVLPGSMYDLRLKVVDNATAQEVVSQRRFQVLKPVSAEAGTAEASQTLIAEDIKREVKIIQYIISKEEQRVFKDLNLEGKGKFLEEFWKRKDPNPETSVNEFREEYMRRFEEANRLFSEGKREGWKSDFGRVFIVYGKPDDVERHANEIDLKPYEVWYYFNIEGGIQFVFGDLDGMDVYSLIHSTARNEVNDPDYFRWLQSTTPR